VTQANKRITVCNNDTDKYARQSKRQKTDENRNGAHFGQSLDKLRKSISQLPSGRQTTVQLTNISPQTAQHCETEWLPLRAVSWTRELKGVKG
jgi:hypothetical protein